MTRDEGHLLLDKIQEGQNFDFEQITAALIATGDLAGYAWWSDTIEKIEKIRGPGAARTLREDMNRCKHETGGKN